MSGEVVLVPLVGQVGIGTAAAATGVGLVAMFAAAAVVSVIRQQQRIKRETAKDEALRQQQQIEAWQTYQATEQTYAERLNDAHSHMHQQLARLKLQATASPSTTPQQAQAQGFLGNTSEAEPLRQLIQSIFQDSQALFDSPASPLPRLQAQWQKLQQTETSIYLLQNFRTTLEYSLQTWQTQLAKQQQNQQQRLAQIQQLLENSLLYQTLVADLPDSKINRLYREELDSLHKHLLQALETQDINATSLKTLQEKQTALLKQIEQAFEHLAIQNGLLQSLSQHLQQLGYQFLQQESTERSLWQIPGGEQLRVYLNANHQFSFQVVHERNHASDAALSPEERRFFHQQENRWCADVPQIMRGLAQDGFQYNMQFERHTPDSVIPIAVLETVDDILEAESQTKGKIKHYFSSPTNSA